MIDDLVDEAPSREKAQESIKEASQVLHWRFSEKSPKKPLYDYLQADMDRKQALKASPLLHSIALLPASRLSLGPLLELLSGFVMDLGFSFEKQEYPIETEEDLEVYAQRVAGTVAAGLLELVFPLPATAMDSAIDTILLPYLQGLAGQTSVVNVDASRFEYEESRVLFPTQAGAVFAFGSAVRLPLEDLATSAAPGDSQGEPRSPSPIPSSDRASATRFWVLRVGRGILMEAGKGIDYSFVNRAFGGIHTVLDDDGSSDLEIERCQDDIDLDEEDLCESTMRASRASRSERVPFSEGSSRPSTLAALESEAARADRLCVSNNRETEGMDDSDDDEDDEEVDSDEDDEEVDGWYVGYVDTSDEDRDGDSDHDESQGDRFGHGLRRKSRHGEVEAHTPVTAHTQVYRGHCNIKTVKDVNFFGLNDEYVVSGSDSGHVFIWDRKTAKLVNILEGDGEVVNVVQGSQIISPGSYMTKTDGLTGFGQVIPTSPPLPCRALIIQSRFSLRIVTLKISPAEVSISLILTARQIV